MRPAEVLLYYLERQERRHRDGELAAATITSYRLRVRHLLTYWGSRDRVTLPACEGYVRRRQLEEGASGWTVHQEAAFLTSAYRWAHQAELIDRGLPSGLTTRAVRRRTQGAGRRLERGEVHALMEHALTPSHRRLYALLANTGLRIREALALRWSDIEDGRIHIRAAKTSTGVRVVPCSSALAAILGDPDDDGGWIFRGRWPEKPMSYSAANYSLKEAAKRAGVGHVTMHDFRRTAASWWIEAGVDARTVAEILGHTDPSFTLRIYARSKDASKVAAVEMMGQMLVGVAA